jgi:hypothetical protein
MANWQGAWILATRIRDRGEGIIVAADTTTSSSSPTLLPASASILTAIGEVGAIGRAEMREAFVEAQPIVLF